MSNALDCFSQLQFLHDWELELHMACLWSLLLQDLHEGKECMVSNSSFSTGTSAAAWILEGAMPNTQIRGECFVPRHDEAPSSFCSELTGIYSV